MPAPLASKVLRQAPTLWNPKEYGWNLKDCQFWDSDGKQESTRWGQDIACPNIHVRPDTNLSVWVFRGWEFVTPVENAKRHSMRCWILEDSRAKESILPWMLSWDLFRDSIKRARGGSFPDDLVLRLPWVEDPLKASTEFDWRMSMAAAEFFIANDHRMWCREQTPTMVVCRAKEFRTLVDQGWTALMRKLKEGEAGDANEEADRTTDSSVAEGHALQVKEIQARAVSRTPRWEMVAVMQLLRLPQQPRPPSTTLRLRQLPRSSPQSPVVVLPRISLLLQPPRRGRTKPKPSLGMGGTTRDPEGAQHGLNKTQPLSTLNKRSEYQGWGDIRDKRLILGGFLAY